MPEFQRFFSPRARLGTPGARFRNARRPASAWCRHARGSNQRLGVQASGHIRRSGDAVPISSFPAMIRKVASPTATHRDPIHGECKMTAPLSSVRISLSFFAAAALLCLAAPAVGQAGAESGPLRMEDIFEVEIAGDPQMLARRPPDRLRPPARRHHDGRPLLEPLDRGLRRVGPPAAHLGGLLGQFAPLVARRHAARLRLEPQRQRADSRPLDGFG